MMKSLFLAAAAMICGMVVSGCATQTELKNTVWVAESLEKHPDIVPATPTTVWFHIDDNGQVTGFSGVNSFSSMANVNESLGRLDFGMPISTLMAGLNLEYERIVLDTLLETRRYELNGNNLILFDQSGSRLATLTPGPDGLMPQK